MQMEMSRSHNMSSYPMYAQHQSSLYGSTDDPLLARAEAAAMSDISKTSTYHHLGLVKPDTLYGGGHSPTSPVDISTMHHSSSSSIHRHAAAAAAQHHHHQMAIHGFTSPSGESMLDQLSSGAVSMPLSGYTPEHCAVVSQAHSAQMYNPVYSPHSNMSNMCSQMQPMSPPPPPHHHSHSGLSPHSASSLPQPSHHDLDCDPRELEAFSEHFKQRRIKLGVTQCDVGMALGKLKIPGVGSLSQSTICRFESLTLSHNNMIALKPVLQAWLEEAEAKARQQKMSEINNQDDKKKKRTSITAAEKRSLEAYFAIQPRPSGEKISQIAEKLGLKKSVVRVWFCNQRQKQKRMKFSSNTGQRGQQMQQLGR